MCKLNTTGTINKIQRINDTVWPCVGYSNAPFFTDNKHMLTECSNNGEFFTINDKNNRVVSNFVETNNKDFETVRSGIANRNIVIYKRHKLSKDSVHFVFIDDPNKTESKKLPLASEPVIDVEKFEKPPLARDDEEPKRKPKIPKKSTSKFLLKSKRSKKLPVESEPVVEVEDPEETESKKPPVESEPGVEVESESQLGPATPLEKPSEKLKIGVTNSKI